MKPSPRSGVSAERRWLLFPRIAALCQDAATPGFMVPMHAKTASGLTLNSVAADVRRLILQMGSAERGIEPQPPYVGCYGSGVQ